MTTHRFVPEQFFMTFATRPPVLTIASGDTVITTTVDAAGVDGDGRQRTSDDGGNWQTGPFAVAGAEPGDLLAVRFMRLTPDRPYGASGALIDPQVIDPDYVRELPRETGQPIDGARTPWIDGEYVEWDLDVEAGTATLSRPFGRLGKLALPLEPMLGCFGVAPAYGEAINTWTSGPHGGNMDYRGFRAGVTIYLPVFVGGALFSLGDVHAFQADGEITGAGIEVSCEVEFAVELLKGQKARWPRGEDAQFIFTVGNARPLEQALQHATTEMLRWLQDGFGLTMVEANLLLGHRVVYEIGNVYDPAYTIACKLPRACLPERASEAHHSR